MIKYPELHKNPMTSDRVMRGNAAEHFCLRGNVIYWCFSLHSRQFEELLSSSQIKDSTLPHRMQFCPGWLCHDCNGMSLYSDHPCNTMCNDLICSMFRPGREPERRHSSYYPNISCGLARTPSHGSDYAKFRDARQTNTMQNAKHLSDMCSMHEKTLERKSIY